MIKEKSTYLIMSLQIKITSFIIWVIYQLRKYLAQLKEKGDLYSFQGISEKRELLGEEETLVVRVARRALTCGIVSLGVHSKQ